jgi:hypothetical protein
MYDQNMSDAQQDNISHLLDHVEEQLFYLSDAIEQKIEDEQLAKELLKLHDKTTLLIEELRGQIY